MWLTARELLDGSPSIAAVQFIAKKPLCSVKQAMLQLWKPSTQLAGKLHCPGGMLPSGCATGASKSALVHLDSVLPTDRLMMLQSVNLKCGRVCVCVCAGRCM